MSGSFWKLSNGFTSLSNVTSILENHTINDVAQDDQQTISVLLKLLDENDLLQELMSNNSMLLEFLRNDNVIGMLVDLLILESLQGEQLAVSLKRLHLSSDLKVQKEEKKDSQEDKDKEIDDEDEDAEKPAKDSDAEKEDDTSESSEERRSRYATLAAEILSADVWSLTDTVMESTQNLNKLWSILDLDQPLSINLATYFMKIMEHLLDMKCEEMITYLIDNQPSLVKKFMNHLSNPPLMDFLLKLISTDKPDNSTGIIDFLQEQELVPQLVEALDISDDADPDVLIVRQSSAADFLKALITISANSTTDNSTIGPNELTRELVSYDIMERLCEIMLKGGYALANGVGIIIEIIRKNNSDYDILPVLYITLESHPPTGRDPIYLGHLLKVFGNKIDEFNKLLIHVNEGSSLLTTFGKIEPLGFERFKICELVAELLHCSNMALLNDNKGFDVVKIRDELRKKMRKYDPVAFKYNEVIELPAEEWQPSLDAEKELTKKFEKDYPKHEADDDNDFNDTIDSFNSKMHDSSVAHHGNHNSGDEDEPPHSNANLTEEEIRANPVIGDYLKIALYDSQIVSNILSMFFKFPWNNFLHNVVFDIVQQVLNGLMDIGFNKILAIDIFHSGEITEKITEGQRLCTEYEKDHCGMRLGYMGHLTLIAEEVVKFIQLYPVGTVSELIDVKVEDESWENYVSQVLFDTRKKYNAILGGSDIDDDEASNTFDESTGEIIEESDFDNGLSLNPNVDHDLIGSSYYHQEKEEEFHEDVDTHEDSDAEKRDQNKLSSSDESESEDDDDHFANYMSLQLTISGSDAFQSTLKSKAKEIKRDEGDERKYNDVLHVSDDGDCDDDDYIDPNDDGMSYKKANPLYDSQGLLVRDKMRQYEGITNNLSEDTSSSSDSDDDDDLDLDVGSKDDSTNKLTRVASNN
uniref:SIT4 phosphatase-associated protein n=1 Tax=Candidozyma auris TaxID=498019 RepID=A0A0L0P5T1_CANAR